MIHNFSKLIFILININSTIYMISTNCWINCFLALEINLFFFIPMIFMSNTFNMEMILKYFIIQTSSSILLMMSILMYKKINLNMNFMMIILMNFCLLMKMGSAPFHYWYIEISNIISWKMFFILSTWQKVGPMIILLYNFNYYLMIMTIILNSIMSMLGGMNQIALKKILSFSSINHLGWMISASLVSEIMTIYYMLIYMIMMFFMLIKIEQFNYMYIYQFFFIKKKKIFMSSFFIYFMSLGGLPPLMGFMPKWMTINKILENNFILLSIILIMCSLLNLFYYFKISYYFIIYKSLKISFNIEFKSLNSFNMYNYMTILNLGYLIIFLFYY